jgi:hypothetical protein
MYKECWFQIYYVKAGMKQSKAETTSDGESFIEVSELGHSWDDAERRGIKADMIESVLHITQALDKDCKAKWDIDENK